MIKPALNLSAPFFAVAGGDLYGIGSDKLGTALLIIMALVFIINQLWALFEKARNAIRKPEADTTGLVPVPICGAHRRSIGRSIDQLRAEDKKQDAANQKRFDDLDQSIKDMRGEMRTDNKEVNTSLESMTLAVGELIGKASK